MSKQPQRAHWDNLTEEEKNSFQNHVGPNWLPDIICSIAASLFKKWYKIASQAHHDFGYTVGGDSYTRHLCDTNLLLAMRDDSKNLTGWKKRAALFIADIFFILLRLFGSLSFYTVKEGGHQKTLEEIRTYIEQKDKGPGMPIVIARWVLLLLFISPLIAITTYQSIHTVILFITYSANDLLSLYGWIITDLL